MVIGPILVDAGPLVAIVNPRDSAHARCIEQLDDVLPPMLTTWPVLAEAAWLLRREPAAWEKLLDSGAKGLYQLAELTEEALPWIKRFCQRYASCAAQLADASLAYVAERDGIDVVFTLDRRDFSIYRIRKNRSFRLVPESL